MTTALFIMVMILAAGTVLSNVFLALGLWTEIKSDSEEKENKWYRPLTMGIYLTEFITAADFLALLVTLMITVVIKLIY